MDVTNDDYQDDFFVNLTSQSFEIESIIKSKYPLLSGIYNHQFFEEVRNQIKAMKRLNISGPIHSVFVSLSKDVENKYKKLDLINDYLSLIITHPTIRKKDKNYLKSELSKDGCLNTWFEISILGNTLKQLDPSNIKLYPTTTLNKNVEAEIKLIDRPIYLETTVLGESIRDRDLRNRMMYANKKVWSGSRDLNADTNRVKLKLQEKSVQFSPNQPNVLVLCFFDFFPVNFQIENAIMSNNNKNIGLIMKFKRESFVDFIEINLDDSCILTSAEKRSLKTLFTGNNYTPLAY